MLPENISNIIKQVLADFHPDAVIRYSETLEVKKKQKQNFTLQMVKLLSLLIGDNMFFKKKHECWMDVTHVTHEIINNRYVTNVLKICPVCGDWDVETVSGTWKVEDFKVNVADKG